jgi:hypothetical protein
MDVGDPESLATAVTSMLDVATNLARNDPKGLLKKLFAGLSALTGSSQPLPDPDGLLQSCHPLDWSSLLTFAMCTIESRLRPSIWLGAAQRAGWAPALTLNYSPDAQLGATPTPPVATVGLSLNGTGTQGIWATVAEPFTHEFSYPPALGLTASMSCDTVGAWQYLFKNQAPNTPPTTWLAAQASVSWNPGWHGVQTSVYDLTLGGVSGSVALNAQAPVYDLQVGLGPLRGTLTPQGALGDGLASRLADLGSISVAYSPSVVVAQGPPATVSLGG